MKALRAAAQRFLDAWVADAVGVCPKGKPSHRLRESCRCIREELEEAAVSLNDVLLKVK